MVKKYEVIVPKTEIDKLLYKYCVSEFRPGYIEFLNEKVIMPINYKDIAEDIENFEVRDDDIWIITYPKTGTTWTQEMVWLIMNNLDFEGAKTPIYMRTAFLEYTGIFDFEAIKNKYEEFEGFAFNSVKLASDKPSPRIIKTHLPWSLLPKALKDENCKAKIIYVTRNPKDTCISYYHHCRLFEGYTGDLETFCKFFLSGRFFYGTYWSMLEFWQRRNNPNILFFTFEEMKKDLSSIIKKTSEFLLGKDLNKDEMSKLLDHLSFESMKNNTAVNYDDFVYAAKIFTKSQEENGKFMRSGKVKGYKTEMSEKIENEFDVWINENTKDVSIEEIFGV